jgi:hypothetical protein
MKLFNLLIAVFILAIGAVAYAEQIGTQHMVTPIVTGFTGAASGSGIFATSATRPTPQNTRATVVFYGYSGATTDAVALVGGTMKGTATLYCAPALTGPFSIVKDPYNNSVTATTNVTFNIDTYCPFYTVSFTRTGGLGSKLSAYLLTGR